MNETTTISEIPNLIDQSSHEVELSSVQPLQPEGVRVEYSIKFVGKRDDKAIADIQSLTGAEQLKLLIKALHHLSDGLQEQLDSFIWSE